MIFGWQGQAKMWQSANVLVRRTGSTSEAMTEKLHTITSWGLRR